MSKMFRVEISGGGGFHRRWEKADLQIEKRIKTSQSCCQRAYRQFDLHGWRSLWGQKREDRLERWQDLSLSYKQGQREMDLGTDEQSAFYTCWLKVPVTCQGGCQLP